MARALQGRCDIGGRPKKSPYHIAGTAIFCNFAANSPGGGLITSYRKMINRILIRIKVVQMLYSYLLTRSDFRIATAPVKDSRDGRYALWLYRNLLLTLLELAGYKVKTGDWKSPMESVGNANVLSESIVARALAADTDVRQLIGAENSGIDSLDGAMLRIYGKIIESAVYTDFRKKRKRDLEEETKFWTVVMATVIMKEPLFVEAARKNPEFTLAGYEMAFAMLKDTLTSFHDTRASLVNARKALDTSLEKAYDLYHALLLLPVNLTRLEAERLENAKEKYCPTPEDLNPNMRFVNNRFVEAIAAHPALEEYAKKHPISWDSDYFLLKELMDNIRESEIYKEYMASDSQSLAADCDLWRQLLKNVIYPSDALAEALESKSVYWNDDLAIIGTFVTKTIRQMAVTGNREIALLPMFKDEEDARFGPELFVDAVNHREEYRGYIDKFINSNQWDPERLAFMDIVILITAIAEMLNIPSVPVPVTINEFIEIANYYSSPRSGQFINGLLFSVSNYLREEGKLLK